MRRVSATLFPDEFIDQASRRPPAPIGWADHLNLHCRLMTRALGIRAIRSLNRTGSAAGSSAGGDRCKVYTIEIMPS
jgi:hypothetical protein